MSDLQAALQVSLEGLYHIERELGGGGMSRVFRARDIALQRDVVIKVLAPELSGDVNTARFRREVQALARLQHPHIVPLLAAGEAANLPYYVMPFVAGESLRERLAREGELPLLDVVRLMREVAEALAHAHAAGIIHRDVKPENVLLESGHAVVADFGIAKAIAEAGGTGGALTSTGVAIGTPVYMAPEQVTGDANVDHRADLYALGVVGYELLVGKPPYAGRMPHAAMAAKLSVDAEPVEQLRAQVPPTLSRLITLCLARSPADRPQSALEVARTLESIITPLGASVSAAQIATPLDRTSVADGSASRWRTRSLVGLVAVGAIGAVAFFARDDAAAGSLVATGELESRARVLVADVASTAGDTVVARALTEALRTDLASTNGARVASRAEIEGALRRMARPLNLPVTDSIAIEISRRDAYAAVVSVAFTPVGAGFLLSARVRDGRGERELATLTERATSLDDLLGALNRLSKDLRGRLGESAGSLKAAQPLERVTTKSFRALQLYSESINEERTRGETARMRTLLSDAINEDSTFAMALRRRAIMLSNGGALEEAIFLARRARDYSQNLPDAEREYTLGTYYAVLQDQARAVEHYRAGLMADSTDDRIRSNLGVALATLQRFPESLVHGKWLRANDSSRVAFLEAEALLALGRLDEAVNAAEAAAKTARRRGIALSQYARVLAGAGYSDSAESLLTSHLALVGDTGDGVAGMRNGLAVLRIRQGRVNGVRAADYARLRSASWAPSSPTSALRQVLVLAGDEAFMYGGEGRAVGLLDSLLRLYPLSTLAPSDRPLDVPFILTLAGKLTAARKALADIEAGLDSTVRRIRHDELNLARAFLLISEGRGAEALPFTSARGFRRSPHAYIWVHGEALALAGKADSAIATYERYLAGHSMDRWFDEAYGYQRVRPKLAELYVTRGDTAKALVHLQAFVAQWANADAQLQPRVAAVRSRITQLSAAADRARSVPVPAKPPH